jgi:hypothetical protein
VAEDHQRPLALLGHVHADAVGLDGAVPDVGHGASAAYCILRHAMPRVPEIRDDGGDPILQDLFAKERAAFGDLLNPTRVLAHCPPILRAAKQLGASIEKSGRLPAALLPLIYLRVALINGCPF